MTYIGIVLIGGIMGYYLSKGKKGLRNKLLWMLSAILVSLGVHFLCAYQFEDKTAYLIYYMTSVLLLAIGCVDFRALTVPMDLIFVGGILFWYYVLSVGFLEGDLEKGMLMSWH